MTLIAEQPNGEQLRFEEWVVRAWAEGRLGDPFLAGPLERATAVYADWPGARARALAARSTCR